MGLYVNFYNRAIAGDRLGQSAADAALLPGETVMSCVIGRLWQRRRQAAAVVLTSERLCVLTELAAAKFVALADIERVMCEESLLDGSTFKVVLADGSYVHLVRTQGPTAEIAAALRRQQAHAGDSSGAHCLDPTSVRSHSSAGKYLGGDYVGNLARQRNLLMPLEVGTEVVIGVSDDGWIDLAERGRYRLDDPNLLIDSLESLGRTFRSGSLKTTAIATLLLGPVGLLGLPFSTERSILQAMTLAVADGDDYGLFSVANADVGLRIKAAQTKAVTALNGEEPVEPEGQTNALNVLAQLGELHRSGVLTDAEFAAKKDDILKRL